MIPHVCRQFNLKGEIVSREGVEGKEGRDRQRLQNYRSVEDRERERDRERGRQRKEEREEERQRKRQDQVKRGC